MQVPNLSIFSLHRVILSSCDALIAEGLISSWGWWWTLRTLMHQCKAGE